MQFKVTWSRYSEAAKKLEFSATGNRDGARFTVVTEVVCFKDPRTPENIHLVALLKLTELFKRPSASGR